MNRRIQGAAWVALAVLLTGLWAPQAAAADDAEGKIDINRAEAVELEALPGIGPELAQRIIEYREKQGPFQRIEDLMNVRGIGEKNFLKIRDRITVGEAKKKG
jgi:competence protein ComEA